MIDFSFDATLRARVATYTGRVDDRELLETYTALLTAADYDTTLNDLVDLTSIENLEVSSDALRELVRVFQPIDPYLSGRRRAIVAPSDSVYGMARMYEILRSDSPEEIRVFRSLDAARDWLAAAVETKRWFAGTPGRVRPVGANADGPRRD